MWGGGGVDVTDSDYNNIIKIIKIIAIMNK